MDGLISLMLLLLCIVLLFFIFEPMPIASDFRQSIWSDASPLGLLQLLFPMTRLTPQRELWREASDWREEQLIS